MKKLMTTFLAAGALLPAQAQLFSPEAFTGAALGAVIGGVAGGDTYRYCGGSYRSFSGDGAAIGAGVGLLAGALVGEARRRDYYDSPGYGYAPEPAVSVGYGYTSYGQSAYAYYAPNAYLAPGYYYRPTRPNYAIGGTLLGAASGALIGAGTGDAGVGAAIGAGAGLVLGGAAESAARRQEQRVAGSYQQTPAPQPQAPQAAAPPLAQNQVTSRPGPDSTYYWTPRPQIADAPFVSDAPTF